jgi:ribosomal protein L40E
MAETETLMCPKCGLENPVDARRCRRYPEDLLRMRWDNLQLAVTGLNLTWNASESIDRSVTGIRRIAIYFLILSIIGAAFEILAIFGLFR